MSVYCETFTGLNKDWWWRYKRDSKEPVVSARLDCDVDDDSDDDCDDKDDCLLRTIVS